MVRVQYVDVENFKSYRAKTRLGPFTDFTSVVGPNGAGKSNIMDAICFVLGVPAREMRCEHLSQLVYRSEADTEEENRARSANVTIALEEEPEEGGDGTPKVTHFSRSVNQDSASTYRINGKVVKYAAYSEVLESHNVLVKARNFLVFQGDVRAISRKSARELTDVIEKVSGSERYRAEYETLREEMERAKEKTVFNLQKRRGISNEKRNMKAQVEEAERYEQLRAEIEQARSEEMLWKLFSVECKVAEASAARTEITASLESVKAAQRAADNLIAEKKRDSAELHKESRILERRLKSAEASVDKAKQTAHRAKLETDNAARKAAGLKTKLAKAQDERRQQAATVADLETQKRSLEEALAESEAQAAAGAAAGSGRGRLEGLGAEQVAEYERCREEAGTRTASLRHDITQLGGELAAEEGLLRNLDAELRALQEKSAAVEKQRRDLQAQREAQLRQMQSFREERDAADKSLAEARTREQEATNAREEIKGRAAEIEQQLTEARAGRREDRRGAQLSEMIETLQRLFPGVRGRLLDLCQPTHRRYNAAISVAMGSAMDAIVVDEEKVAIQCLAHLRQQRLGIATFIPLDTVDTKPVNERYRALGDGIQLVHDVLKYPAVIKKAVEYAVGNTVVCDTLDTARALCFGGRERYKAVTLDGAKIAKSGLMTGGGAGIAERARRWDDKEIDELRRESVRLAKQMRAIDDRRKKAARVEDLDATLRGLDSRIAFTRDTLKGIDHKLESADKDYAATVKRIRELEPARAERAESIESIRERIATKERQRAKVEEGIFAAFTRKVGVDSVREFEEGHLRAARELQARVIELRQQISRIDSELNFVTSHDHAGKVAELEAEIRSLEDSLTLRRKRDAEAQASLAEETAAIEKSRAELNALRRRMDDVDVAIREHKKSREAGSREIAALGKRFATEDARLEQLRQRRTTIVRQCHTDRIDLPLDDGDEIVDSDDDDAEASDNNKNNGGGGDDPMDVDNAPRKSRRAAAASRRRASGAAAAAAAAVAEDGLPMVSEVTYEDMLRGDGSDSSFSAAGGSTQEGASQQQGQQGDDGAGAGAAGAGAGAAGAARSFDRKVGFGGLSVELRAQVGAAPAEEATVQRLQERVATLSAEADRIAPNMKAVERFGDVKEKLKQTSDEFETARREAQLAVERFEAVKTKRRELFMSAFTHLSSVVDGIYKDLTRTPGLPLGGNAYLTLDDQEQPFEGGVKYSVLPPGKRFRDMELLSGGEQTLSALALLFAFQSFRSSGFFILDEIDAALDSANVAQVSKYIRRKASSGLQFIVISHKERLYERSNSLVGVYRKNAIDSSRSLTLDLLAYPEVDAM